MSKRILIHLSLSICCVFFVRGLCHSQSDSLVKIVNKHNKSASFINKEVNTLKKEGIGNIFLFSKFFATGGSYSMLLWKDKNITHGKEIIYRDKKYTIRILDEVFLKRPTIDSLFDYDCSYLFSLGIDEGSPRKEVFHDETWNVRKWKPNSLHDVYFKYSHYLAAEDSEPCMSGLRKLCCGF